MSYTWGDRNYTGTIHIVNLDLEITITQNGIEALQDLLDTSKIRVVWMDAVCINQKDEIEKAAQISMMGHLYFFAESCVACVGRKDTVSSNVFQMVNSDEKYRSEPLVTKKLLVNSFMKRPWFKRLWVVQEALLSEKITIQCGRQSMEIEEFSLACQGLFS